MRITHTKLIKALANTDNHFTVSELSDTVGIHTSTVYRLIREEDRDMTLTKYIQNTPEGGEWTFSATSGKGNKHDPVKLKLIYTDPGGCVYESFEIEDAALGTIGSNFEGFGDFFELVSLVQQVYETPYQDREALKEEAKSALDEDRFEDAYALLDEIKTFKAAHTHEHYLKVGRIVCQNFDVLQKTLKYLENTPEKLIQVKGVPVNEDTEKSFANLGDLLEERLENGTPGELEELERILESLTGSRGDDGDDKEDLEESDDPPRAFLELAAQAPRDSRTLMVTNKADARLPKPVLDHFEHVNVMRLQETDDLRDQTRVNRCVGEIHRGVFDFVLVDPDVIPEYAAWIESAATKSKKDVVCVTDVKWEV